jgi:hypothetical protein
LKAQSIRFIVTACIAMLVSSCAVLAQDDALRKEFEALYAKRDEAFKSKDAGFIKSLLADDYTAKGKGGNVKSRADEIRATDEMFPNIKEVPIFVTKVEGVKQGKDENEAIVETSNTGKIVFVAPDGQTHRITGKGKSRETWIRTGAGWKIRYSEDLESTVTEEEADWAKYTSSDGRYSVLLPGKPTVETNQTRQFQAILVSLPATYSIAYWDLTPDQTYSLDDWHDGQIKDLKGKGTVLTDNSITLSGYPGRQLVTVEKDSGEDRVGWQRLYKVDERIYLVIFTYLKSDENDALKAKGSKFFDSFQITKKP